MTIICCKACCLIFTSLFFSPYSCVRHYAVYSDIWFFSLCLRYIWCVTRDSGPTIMFSISFVNLFPFQVAWCCGGRRSFFCSWILFLHEAMSRSPSHAFQFWSPTARDGCSCSLWGIHRLTPTHPPLLGASASRADCCCLLTRWGALTEREPRHRSCSQKDAPPWSDPSAHTHDSRDCSSACNSRGYSLAWCELYWSYGVLFFPVCLHSLLLFFWTLSKPNCPSWPVSISVLSSPFPVANECVLFFAFFFGDTVTPVAASQNEWFVSGHFLVLRLGYLKKASTLRVFVLFCLLFEPRKPDWN